FGGDMCRVKVERRENHELTEIRYYFQYFPDGVWPADWQSLGIPAPRYSAIVGAFDLKSWNDKENWYGSFQTNMKFLGANLEDYAATLKKNGFTETEYTYRNWELEKRVRIGGVWYKVTIYDAGNYEIPDVRYEFRKE
ncbi:MAG: hypothetical protein FWE49_05660, partial [Synergistaceae bacterium]|nr:hypothetical protein [Synergistaceae bacterium]